MAAFFSGIRTSAYLLQQLQRSTNIRRFSVSLSSSFSPDSGTSLTGRQKSRAALSHLKFEKAPDRIIEICRAAQLSPDSHVDRIALSVAVETLVKEEQFPAVSQLLDEFVRTPLSLKSDRFASHAIVLYGQANMLDHAIRTFSELDQLGIPRTVNSLNALIFACLAVKDYNEAKRIYNEMPKKYGIEPDLETYNRMIKVYSQSESTRSAYSIVEEMERKGITPTRTSFGMMLAGFHEEEKHDDVNKVLQMMRERGLSLEVFTYNVRIQSMCKRMKSAEAKALLDEMISSEIQPNSATYCHLIRGFCKEDNLDEAKKIFETMVNRGCKPDSECYFTLIYHLCKEEDFMTALSFCRESMEKKWVPNFATMKSLVNGLASISKIDEAKELIAQMKQRFPKNAELWNEVEASLPLMNNNVS